MSQIILNANGLEGVLSARTRALRKVGFRVAEAASENETLRLSCDAKPNLILMGKMPRLSPEMCIRLKADPATARIPVIAVCSPGAEKVWARKADLCLPETITSSQLVSVIQLILQAKDAEQDDSNALPESRNVTIARRGPDRARGTGERLRRHNQELDDFCKIAHNLRSTLCTVTVISSWIVGEYSDRMDSSGRECLGLLQRSVERMSAVIDSVLKNRKSADRREDELQTKPKLSTTRAVG
jgi:response regulator RpfG family c-di-GMP phosphodiesterase